VGDRWKDLRFIVPFEFPTNASELRREFVLPDFAAQPSGGSSRQFSEHSGLYARARPAYPDVLFEAIARELTNRNLAWDCGTGSVGKSLG